MTHRAAFLIRCSADEATAIRNMAKTERRSMSGYVLNILMRAIAVDQMLLRRLGRPRKLTRMGGAVVPLASPSQPRAAVLVRCSVVEARQVRAAARREEETISGFTLHLKRAWRARAGGQITPTVL
jgi:uncharacterized protein (DUF1778 family)